MRLPYRLPGLAHGFVCHGATVYDDYIVLIGQLFGQCIALRQIEAAAHADHFDLAHPKSSQSISPLKT